jgi:spore germination cell wall hydrolase CwlJ-like protein
MTAGSGDSLGPPMQAKLRTMHALRIAPWPKVSGYAFAFAILALAVFGLLLPRIAWIGTPGPGPADRPRSSTPPRPEIQLVRRLTPEQAIAMNEARPIGTGELQTALAFKFEDKLASPAAYRAAVECLTAAIYYEAAGESEDGQKAVAQVVLNRVRHPAFPQTVCGVVYQGSDRTSGCQFTFTCDGSLTRQPSRGAWERARLIAEGALAGQVEAAVGMATHYHANWVVPYWAPNLDKVAVVGNHIFYRWRGFWGQRQAFSRRYAGETADLPQLAYAGNLLAEWIEDSSKPVGLSTAADAPRRNDRPSGQRPLVADLSAPELAADDARGKLVVDESPGRAPNAQPLGVGF